MRPAVQDLVVQAFMEECEWNAVSGYPHDLPAPEVFERPGWRTIVAPWGSTALRLSADHGISTFRAATSVPPWPPQEPVVVPSDVGVRVDGILAGRLAPLHCRVGWDLAERVIVLFWL